MESPFSSLCLVDTCTVRVNDDPVRHRVSAPVSLSSTGASYRLPGVDHVSSDLIRRPPSSNITVPNATVNYPFSLNSPTSPEGGSKRRRLNEIAHGVGTLRRQMMSLPPAPLPTHPTNANLGKRIFCYPRQLHEQGVHGFKEAPRSSLSSQLSFNGETRDIHPQISEIRDRKIFNVTFDSNRSQYDTHRFDFGQESNAVTFSPQGSKSCDKDQVELQTAIDILSSVEKQHKYQDLFNFKFRAKSGCTTDPRCVAERERRNRIYGNLKKLQDLVPNVDKQSSYAEMLVLAAEHINNLQDEVQKLREVNKICKRGRNEEEDVNDG